MKFEKKDIFSIPNILTYIRLLSLPFYLWMMFAFKINGNGWYLFTGFLIFVFAEITDVLDGYIARHYNMITDIGKVIDPIADKVLQCFSLITLAVLHSFLIPFMAILIVKEVFMGVSSRYFMVASKKQVEQKSNKLGKAGATLNFITILVAFAVGVDHIFSFTIPSVIVEIIKWFDIILMIVSIVLAIAAATNYTIGYSKKLKELRESGILDTLDKDGNPIEKKEDSAE